MVGFIIKFMSLSFLVGIFVKDWINLLRINSPIHIYEVSNMVKKNSAVLSIILLIVIISTGCAGNVGTNTGKDADKPAHKEEIKIEPPPISDENLFGILPGGWDIELSKQIQFNDNLTFYNILAASKGSEMTRNKILCICR